MPRRSRGKPAPTEFPRGRGFTPRRSRGKPAPTRVRLFFLCGLMGVLGAGCSPEEGAADSAAMETTEPARVPTTAEWKIFRGDAGLRGQSPGDASERPGVAWRTKLEEDVIAAPVVAAGSVFVACEDGLIYSLDEETGSENWRFDNDFGFEASPLFSDGRIFIGSLDGIFYCLDAATGELIWENRRETKIAASANTIEIDVNEEGSRKLVVFGSYDNLLYAVDAGTGEEVWSYQTDNYINGAPAITTNGEILFGGCDAYAHVVDSANGESIRQIFLNTYIPASVALDGGKGYAGNYDGELLGFDVGTGEIQWTNPLGGSFETAPAVGGSLVLAAGADRRLYALDQNSGELVWKYDPGRRLESSPIVIGSTVVVADSGGEIHALDLAAGAVRWTFDLGGSVVSSPVVANNRLFVGDENGWLHALNLDGSQGEADSSLEQPESEESPFVDWEE